jgi:hypothetical protein
VLPALHEASTNPEPLIAEHANWAMQRINERQRVKDASLSAG